MNDIIFCKIGFVLEIFVLLPTSHLHPLCSNFLISKRYVLRYNTLTSPYLTKLIWIRWLWAIVTLQPFIFPNSIESRCYILVSLPSHLKKLRSILRFWLEKLNCGFFFSFHSRKTPQNNFSSQNFSVENNYFYDIIFLRNGLFMSLK